MNSIPASSSAAINFSAVSGFLRLRRRVWSGEAVTQQPNEAWKRTYPEFQFQNGGGG
jgi:hypothetical protein